MKHCIIAFLFFAASISCSSDPMDKDCTPQDYVGNYSGTLNCGLVQQNVSAVVTVATPNTINIIIDGEITTCEVQGCMIIIPEVDIDVSGTLVTTTGTGTLDGNTLTLDQTAAASGGAFSCTTTLVK